MNKPFNDGHWSEIETYKSMIAFANGMLRFIFLANGGAIIAILTFVGNSEECGTRPHLWIAVSLYLLGLFLAGLTTGTAYWTQFVLLNEQQGRFDGTGWHGHMRWLWVSFFVMSVSLISFGIGSIVALASLE